MKKYLLLGTAIAAMGLSGPVAAQESENTEAAAAKGSSADTEAFAKLFGSMFEKDETPIEPAMLSKGERIAGAVVPKGSYRKIMAETFQKVIEPMMEGLDEFPLSAIAVFTGVSEEDISLKEGATLADLMAIVDPYYKQRNRSMMSKFTDIMIDLSDDIEPSIREGLSRAYARRFSADELEAAAAFYETEAGAKIAGESLSIFASPEVMSASMEMMPKFMEELGSVMEEMTNGSDDIPPPRKFEDLSDTELTKLSELMGVGRDALSGSSISNWDEVSEDAVEESGEEPWTDSVNWAVADRDKVNKLNADYDAAFDRYYDALQIAQENAKKRMQADK